LTSDFNSRVLALIPARGGSKRLPRKNLLACGDRPLIAHTIAAAVAMHPPLGHVAVSTDDEEIAATSRSLGAEVPFLRPAVLSSDAATSIDVARHALDWYRENASFAPDWLLLLQPTSPLRTASDIEAALSIAAGQSCDSVIGVAAIRHGHPVHAKRLAGGLLKPYMSEHGGTAEVAYAVNGAIYLTRTAAVRQGTFYGERSLPYLMPAERSIDIDDRFDLELASYLFANPNRDGA
jgi:CMP-N-acetylneuraminic acid synthetase